MRAVIAPFLILIAGIAACNDSQPGTPTSPDLRAGGPPSGCSYSQIKKDVDAEWPNSAGADTKATGPTIPAGMTFSAKKLDERTFEFTEKHDGKPIYKMTFKASEDGKSMTETGKPVGVDEPFMAVYDRQDKTTHPTE